MGFMDGLFESGILGSFGQQNMSDQKCLSMQQEAQAAQKQYYDQLRQYAAGQFKDDINKAKRKKFDFDEADIIDVEFEIITEVKALPELE